MNENYIEDERTARLRMKELLDVIVIKLIVSGQLWLQFDKLVYLFHEGRFSGTRWLCTIYWQFFHLWIAYFFP